MMVPTRSRRWRRPGPSVRAEGVGTRRLRRARGGERGSVSVEFAIVGSAVIVMFFSLMIVAGRILQQENDVRSAAQAAARAASLRDNAADAQAVATAVVNENLEQTGVSCDGGATVTMTSSPDHGPGSLVRVEVICTARSLASLGLPAVTYDYRATEIIDAYRGTP